MSLIEEKNFNYLTSIEQFVLALKDSGMALSANDYHLIEQWEKRGVPLERLLRAIEKSFSEFKRKAARSGSQKVSLSLLSRDIESIIDGSSHR